MSGPRKLGSRREHTGDRQLDAMQSASQEIERRVNVCPFLNGVLRSVRLVNESTATVNHGLGTRATFIVARTNYDGTDYYAAIGEDVSQAGIDLSNQLNVFTRLVSSGPLGGGESVLVDLWFYPIASERVPR